MKIHHLKKTGGTAVVAAFCAVWAIGTLGCGGETPLGNGSEGGELTLLITPAGKTVPGDRLGIRVSGQGLPSMAWSGPVESEVRMEGIPPGNDRTVEGWITDSTGRHAYRGEKTVDLSAGTNSLALSLQPQFVTLLASFLLGAGNPAGVTGGDLILTREGDTLRVPLELGSYKARFLLDRLYFGDDWDLFIEIRGDDGLPLYSLSQQLIILPNSPKELYLDLSMLRAELVLTIQLADPEELDISLGLPSAIKRSPVENEVIFTELMIYPKTSGDPWEWMELMNLSRDTLSLGSCVIARSRTASTVQNRLELGDGLVIPPIRRIVLGRDSVAFADWNYSSFTLTNTTQPLALYCGETVVDSIEYKQYTDPVNPFPTNSNKPGTSLELDLDRWPDRLLGSSWSAGVDSLDMGGWWVFGTPGR